MTANQIGYWANVERNRSNEANEELRNREIEETARANQVREQQQAAALEEQKRHNRHAEAQGYINAAGNLVSSFIPGTSKSAPMQGYTQTTVGSDGSTTTTSRQYLY